MPRRPTLRDRLRRLAYHPRTAGLRARLVHLLDPDLTARHQKQLWSVRWGHPGFRADWLDRGVAAEVIEAVEHGWFPAGQAALDVGCGEADIAAWLATQDIPTRAVDLAPQAIARARARHGAVPGLTFAVADVVATPPAGGPYHSVVDRGCFHCVAPLDRPAYVRHLAAACAPSAHLLLGIKRAWSRGGGEPAASEATAAHIAAAFAPHFRVDRWAQSHMDAPDRVAPNQKPPGLVFWMTRT